jgi:sec-independent protein translocase protein TatC
MSTSEKEMSFLDHLEELRKRLIRAALAVVAGAIVIFVSKEIVFDQIIFAPRQPDFLSFRAWCALGQWIGAGDRLCVKEIKYTLQSTTMLGQFTTHLLVSIVGGIIIAFPYIFSQFWQFVKPGLRQNELKSVRGIVVYTTLLFFLGVLFGYYGLLPLSLQFLGSYQLGDVPTISTINSYIKLMVSVTLATGLVFQLPVMIYFLTRIGLVSSQMLRNYRKHALVAILVLAAIITPPDVTSQILVAMPILVLYEVGIMVAKRVERKRAA